jgi:hypothetical protein
MPKQLLRRKKICERLACGPTKFWEDFIESPGKLYVPGTNIRRLHPVRTGGRSVGVFEDDVDRLLNELAALPYEPNPVVRHPRPMRREMDPTGSTSQPPMPRRHESRRSETARPRIRSRHIEEAR